MVYNIKYERGGVGGERELTRAMPSPELLTVPPIHWPLVDSNVYSLNAVSVITKNPPLLCVYNFIHSGFNIGFSFHFLGALPYWTLMQIFQFNFFIKELIMFVVPLPTCIRILYWNTIFFRFSLPMVLMMTDSPDTWCNMYQYFSLTMLIISDSPYLCYFNMMSDSSYYVPENFTLSLPMLLMISDSPYLCC